VSVPVSAATLSWSVVETPNSINVQLQPGIDVDFLLMAPDGHTMFAYDNSVHQLYKSTDTGTKWATTGIGNGLEDDINNSGLEDAGDDIVAIAVSPDYTNDSTVVAAIGNKVFRSMDGGKTFGELGTNVGNLIAAGSNITSIAVSPWYQGGIAILVGDSDGSQGGGVSLFTSSGLSWDDLKVGDWDGDGTVNDQCDVLTVAFSPDHRVDSQILAVVTYDVGGTINTRLTTKFQNTSWGEELANAPILEKEATGAVIAFPDNYNWSSYNRIFVGTSGTDTVADDVFRIHGSTIGASISVFDLNVNGSSNDTDVHSIAVKGSLASGTVIVGQKDTTAIRRSTSASASAPNWNSSSKSPTGDSTNPNTTVLWSTTLGEAFAATSGAGSALSRSINGGLTWNQCSLIDISAVANIALTDIEVVDNSTIYLLMWDDADNSSAFSAGDYTMLFKTTNGGALWEQIWTHRSTGTEALNLLSLSNNYVNDNTLFVAQNNNGMWKSVDAGKTFSMVTVPKDITAVYVVSKNVYYTGHDDAIYKSGKWTGASLGGAAANSIVVSAIGAVFVGTDEGDVLLSSDLSQPFYYMGEPHVFGNNAEVIIGLDRDFTSNGIVYAGTANSGAGVKRWIWGTSTKWQRMDDDSGTLFCTGLESSVEGIFYAASNSQDKGIRRCVSPTESISQLEFESVLDGLPSNAKLERLKAASGTTLLYALASNVAAGTYGYQYRLITFSDVIGTAPVLNAPLDEALVSDTVVLSWQGVESPVEVKYRYQVAMDAEFANKFIDRTTTAASATITDLIRGTDYWWRVYVKKGEPLLSRKSAVRSFTTEFQPPIMKSPDYGDDSVQRRPMFSWLSVEGANSYELEFADNADFENAVVLKPIDHTIWTWDKDLEYSTSYYWRIRAVKRIDGLTTITSPWTESVFTIKSKPVEPVPAVVVQEAEELEPISITMPPPILIGPHSHLPPPKAPVIAPVYIWVIVILFFLIFAAITGLIITTRRMF